MKMLRVAYDRAKLSGVEYPGFRLITTQIAQIDTMIAGSKTCFGTVDTYLALSSATRTAL